MAQKVNYFLTRAFDLLLAPFAKLPPFWGILFLSLLTSLFVLAVYKLVSNPAKVRETKNLIKAHILAIRLYRDFWRTILASFFKSLYYTGKYFALNLLPLLLVLPLMFLLFVQMDIRYGMRPFRAGESFTVKARFSGPIDAVEAVVEPSDHYQTTMNPVHIPALREIDWKLRVGQNGSGDIAITVNGNTVRKNLLTGAGQPALSNKRMSASGWGHFIYPVEKLLAPAPALEYISLQYPARSISFLVLRTHWLVYYLVLTMIIALALKKKFGVEF
ncbi:MAG: hypothetical protein NTW95_00270 [Candidatus Aminicenantes bacterium]|nr:hypothetical protein [Candidatus Aminicenantes bacterium]